MRKLFTIDDFMVAFISALGYGYGETLAMLAGWPELMCVVACFAVGLTVEEIITNIVFSKIVQKSLANRMLVYIAIVTVFLVAQYVSLHWMNASMMEYLDEEFAWVVGLPVLGFFVTLLKRWYRIRKIREVYGDGSEGFVFDLDDRDIEETNEQNRPMRGEYDASFAVKTRTGVYVGEKNGKAVEYLGIPYAKPPVGDLRWRAPEPLPASDDVLEAVNFGASAIQVEHEGSIKKYHRQSEDCLTLNIWVSEKSAESKRPVLVLFHHGDFTEGGSVDPLLYADEYVAAHPDVVVVSFNYRLGIFGFIDFSEVPGGESRPDTSNLGLLDQIAALRWIKENIAAFGGDPDQITVLGFEAGAVSIMLLAVSEQARGLFQRAFIFNGSPAYAHDTPDASRALARDLLRETQTATMEELLRLDTEVLKDAAQRLWPNVCAPTCDGRLVPARVYEACREGAASGIEFIFGIPSNQAQVFKSLVGNQKYAGWILFFMTEMEKYLDDATANAVRAYLEEQAEATSELEAKSRLAEQWNALGIYRAAARLSEGGSNVHVMYWGEKPLIENLGSGAVDAAAALLGNEDALQMYGDVMNGDLSEMLQAFLQKFVTGEALQLYRNELDYIDAFEWEAFPQALVVADGKLQCDTIGDKLTEIDGLLDCVLKYT